MGRREGGSPKPGTGCRWLLADQEAHRDWALELGSQTDLLCHDRNLLIEIQVGGSLAPIKATLCTQGKPSCKCGHTSCAVIVGHTYSATSSGPQTLHLPLYAVNVSKLPRHLTSPSPASGWLSSRSRSVCSHCSERSCMNLRCAQLLDQSSSLARRSGRCPRIRRCLAPSNSPHFCAARCFRRRGKECCV